MCVECGTAMVELEEMEGNNYPPAGSYRISKTPQYMVGDGSMSLNK